MAEMSFLSQIAGLSLKDRVRGSIIWGVAQIRVDDQHQESAEVVQALMIRMHSGAKGYLLYVMLCKQNCLIYVV